VILALAVAALTLYALVETGALARWAAALAARQWAREEEAAEPGALPRAVPGALPSRTVPAAPAPVLPRVDTVRSDTLDAEARPGRRPGARRFGVQAVEGRILERLDRSRPDPRALTGIARVRVTDLAIEEPDGPRFAEAARAEFGIDLGALQTGDVLLSDVVLVKPDAVLRRGPGQDWNYQRAWRTIVGARGADADGGPPGGGTLELTDVRISGGRLVVESPGTSVAILGLDADIARATLSDPSAPAPEVLARSASGDVVLPGIDRRFAVAPADAEARADDAGTAWTTTLRPSRTRPRPWTAPGSPRSGAGTTRPRGWSSRSAQRPCRWPICGGSWTSSPTPARRPSPSTSRRPEAAAPGWPSRSWPP